MKLNDLIPPERILLDINASSVEEVISALVHCLSEGTPMMQPVCVIQAVLNRERQVGTGIGNGVAIPHAEPGPYPEPLVALGRLAIPVDFHAPDGVKTRLVFLLLTPEDKPALHVRLLARICRLTRSAVLREHLMQAASPAGASQIINAFESDYPELNP